MNQPNELKDFWRRTVTIYVDDIPFQRYQYVPIYEFRQPDKIETEMIKNLIDKQSPYYNNDVYNMVKNKFNGDIWYKNGYVKIYNSLDSGYLLPYKVCKIKDNALVTIKTTYNKAYHNMSKMMEQVNPDDFISYMKDRGMTVCPMINK
jgi:hypothetical protein|nr:MAG TPA: hypothetical protein [Caudoviricetes sp.]